MNYKRSHVRQDEEEQDEYSGNGTQLEFGFNSMTITRFSVNLDEQIKEPSYYRNVIAMLNNAGQHDHVDFYINSNGGAASGMISLIEAIKRTEASTRAILVGECASAASIIAMHCEDIEVTDHASMLCHTVRFGVIGKLPDVEKQAKATGDQARKILRSAYEGFLTEKEIELVIEGHEHYLSADEIRTRLELIESRQAEQEAEQAKQTKTKTTKKT